MKKHHRRSNPTSSDSGAAARERRFDAIQRRRSRRPNPPIRARQGILCYDPGAGILKGDESSPFNELEVEVFEVFENSATVLVRHEELPNGELIVPLCPDDALVVGGLTSAEPPPRDLTGCCVDEQAGLITCPGGKDQWYMHGRTVPMATLGCASLEDGTRVCTIHTGDHQIHLPACPEAPPPPPSECCVDMVNMVLVCADESDRFHGAQVVEILTEQDDGLLSVSFVDPTDGATKNARFYPCVQPPQECCYDVATGRLRCLPAGSAFDGLDVSLLSMQAQEDGSISAIVMSPELKPNSTIVVPLCDDPVVDCCYDPTTERLVCPGGELDGQAAGAVQTWVGPDGQIYVWAAWQGGGARMPLCPGTEECPPVFCCVNMNTMNYVCPGQPELNDKAAPIGEIVTEDGYSWALLEDGTRVPLCGERCPPPQLCPDCPSCPPGQWMSPDGTCEVPELAPPPPPSPPKEPCCDECAHGRECESGKSGGHKRRRLRNPESYAPAGGGQLETPAPADLDCGPGARLSVVGGKWTCVARHVTDWRGRPLDSPQTVDQYALQGATAAAGVQTADPFAITTADPFASASRGRRGGSGRARKRKIFSGNR